MRTEAQHKMNYELVRTDEAKEKNKKVSWSRRGGAVITQEAYHKTLSINWRQNRNLNLSSPVP